MKLGEIINNFHKGKVLSNSEILFSIKIIDELFEAGLGDLGAGRYELFVWDLRMIREEFADIAYEKELTDNIL